VHHDRNDRDDRIRMKARQELHMAWYSAMRILAVPNRYCDLVKTQGEKIESLPRYNILPDKVPQDTREMVKYFAVRGITPVEASDACDYARNWLRMAENNHYLSPEQVATYRSEKDRVWTQSTSGALNHIDYYWNETLGRWTMQEGFKRLLNDDERYHSVKTSEGLNQLQDDAGQHHLGQTSAQPASLKGGDTSPSKTQMMERVSTGEDSGRGEDQPMFDLPLTSIDDDSASGARMEEDPPSA